MVVATGFFAGVHLGHRLVLDELVRVARERGEESAVATLWPHPRNVLQQDARHLRLLTSLEEKKAMMKALGVDRVEVLEFTRRFSALTMEQYLSEIVVGRLGAGTVLLGYDNRIGSDCSSPEDVASVAEALGLEVIRTSPLPAGGRAVSSTRIREALSSGDVKSAAGMLGYAYGLRGVVVAGNCLGRTIGFPTANMKLYEPLKLIPGGGVYLVRVNVLGEEYHGMCNIGCRPTVSGNGAMTIETNIFDFDEDIYGLDMEISFMERIRDEKKFASLNELGRQLAKDREGCLRFR